MFKRGDVVKDEQRNIGIVLWDQCPACDYVTLCWLTENLDPDNVQARLAVELTPVADPERYAFEAALALGDTAKVLEMYRTLQSALAPFAAYGHLKLHYPDKAVFTVAYDRNGQTVTLFFSDFTRAAALLPRTDQPEQGGAQIGGRGGIAEIMEVKP